MVHSPFKLLGSRLVDFKFNAKVGDFIDNADLSLSTCDNPPFLLVLILKIPIHQPFFPTCSWIVYFTGVEERPSSLWAFLDCGSHDNLYFLALQSFVVTIFLLLSNGGLIFECQAYTSSSSPIKTIELLYYDRSINQSITSNNQAN
ncbi:hypothetical protein IEQ34_013024 [Dendrobium chrysotoxum]|uniref:Uncharacterized protein n=1 Tax=Dendrobium chrysotoxum TaxID=161865 RepID=A0AAV7G783_DENCH|nr:hypothetical protein IEQ34_013024 [Dendrobium chrysotoxum]